MSLRNALSLLVYLNPGCCSVAGVGAVVGAGAALGPVAGAGALASAGAGAGTCSGAGAASGAVAAPGAGAGVASGYLDHDCSTEAKPREGQYERSFATSLLLLNHLRHA